MALSKQQLEAQRASLIYSDPEIADEVSLPVCSACGVNFCSDTESRYCVVCTLGDGTFHTNDDTHLYARLIA